MTLTPTATATATETVAQESRQEQVGRNKSMQTKPPLTVLAKRLQKSLDQATDKANELGTCVGRPAHHTAEHRLLDKIHAGILAAETALSELELTVEEFRRTPYTSDWSIRNAKRMGAASKARSEEYDQ